MADKPPAPQGQFGSFRHIIRGVGDRLMRGGGHLAFAAATDLGKAMFALSDEFDGGFGGPCRPVKGPAPEIAAGYLRAAAARLGGRPGADRLTGLASELCRDSGQAGQDGPEHDRDLPGGDARTLTGSPYAGPGTAVTGNTAQVQLDRDLAPLFWPAPH